jgi:uncharacterized membrane protein YeiH
MNNSVPRSPAGHGAVQHGLVVTTADLAGTFVFALEGAFAAIGGQLDLFGVLVLAFATALGGGIIRDVLMGSLPPSALRGWSYPSTAFLAAAIAFGFGAHFQIPRGALLTLDAAGLSLFAVAGAEKASNGGIHPLSAILLGTITGVGGGTIRDVLLGHIPAILRVDVYATAALLGAAVLVTGRQLRLSPTVAALTGATACFVLRLLSVWNHWQLPGSTGAG